MWTRVNSTRAAARTPTSRPSSCPASRVRRETIRWGTDLDVHLCGDTIDGDRGDDSGHRVRDGGGSPSAPSVFFCAYWAQNAARSAPVTLHLPSSRTVGKRAASAQRHALSGLTRRIGPPPRFAYYCTRPAYGGPLHWRAQPFTERVARHAWWSGLTQDFTGRAGRLGLPPPASGRLSPALIAHADRSYTRFPAAPATAPDHPRTGRPLRGRRALGTSVTPGPAWGPGAPPRAAVPHARDARPACTPTSLLASSCAIGLNRPRPNCLPLCAYRPRRSVNAPRSGR